MGDERCSVCGETRLEGWDVCPACGHPFEDPDDDAPTNGGEDGEDGDDGAWWRA